MNKLELEKLIGKLIQAFMRSSFWQCQSDKITATISIDGRTIWLSQKGKVLAFGKFYMLRNKQWEYTQYNRTVKKGKG